MHLKICLLCDLYVCRVYMQSNTMYGTRVYYMCSLLYISKLLLRLYLIFINNFNVLCSGQQRQRDKILLQFFLQQSLVLYSVLIINASLTMISKAELAIIPKKVGPEPVSLVMMEVFQSVGYRSARTLTSRRPASPLQWCCHDSNTTKVVMPATWRLIKVLQCNTKLDPGYIIYKH